ncbi:ditrans,polycis-polyprenyl diphosphate synthase [(2E,6E)-farnesydiphosphate specific] [Ranunculus cassubicifolius]
MVGLGTGIFEVGQAAVRAATVKLEKHEAACASNQHVFIPFAFDTFGFLAPDSVQLLNRLQKVMDNNVMTAGSNEYVFRRITFAIQKGLAAQLVARMSSTFV